MTWNKKELQNFESCAIYGVSSTIHWLNIQYLIYPPFEQLGPGATFSKVPRTFRARKASFQTVIRLFWKADLLTCFLRKKSQEDCEVWWLRTSAWRRYKGNCGTRNTEKFRDFRETGLWLGRNDVGAKPCVHGNNAMTRWGYGTKYLV